MSDTTTDTPAPPAPPDLRVVQCPFCLHDNRVINEDAICAYCGLTLKRTIAMSNGTAATPAPAPAPSITPLTPGARPPVLKGRAKKRHKQKTGRVLGDPAPQLLPQQPAPRTPTPVVVAPATPVFQSAPVTVHDVAAEATLLERATRHDTDAVDEATIIANVATRWVLEFEDGTVVDLPADDVVIGRRPVATTGATPVTLPDPTRSLSRTHARMRRDITRDTWTITDMKSGNGVAIVSDTGVTTYLDTDGTGDITEYLLLGTVRCRLRHDTATRT